MRSLTVNSESEIDPVCGMTVDPASAAGSFVHKGKTYHFCSRHCLEKFQADPERYLKSNASAENSCCPGINEETKVRSAGPGTQYTCPMHPEIIRDRPGTCPKCGMALEPIIPHPDQEDSTELQDMTRRFWVSLVLAVPVFVLSMVPMLPGIHLALAFAEAANWIGLIFSTPVVFWAGRPFFERAIQALRHRTTN